jgi:hypothetical protein
MTIFTPGLDILAIPWECRGAALLYFTVRPPRALLLLWYPPAQADLVVT